MNPIGERLLPFLPPPRNRTSISAGSSLEIEYEGQRIHIRNTSNYEVAITDIYYDDEDESAALDVVGNNCTTGILITQEINDLTIVNDDNQTVAIIANA